MNQLIKKKKLLIMAHQNSRIEEIKNNGYQLDFGNVFEHAFQNYKKIALYGGLMILVFSILFYSLLAIILFSFYDFTTISETMKPENMRHLTTSVNFLLLNAAITILIGSLLSPFSAGFLKMADCGEKGKEFHISTIFEYYKAPYFKEIVISTFLITIVNTGLTVLFNLSKMENIGLFISLILSFLTFLTVPLIIFGNLKAVDAIKSSIAIVAKQPLVILGLLIVAIIFAMVGFIGCCIGIFFTIPFLFSMSYAIYSAIIGVDSENEIE